MVVLPIAPQQRSGVEINNVVREDKRDVLLLARAHQLIFVPEGEDVIADDIVTAVMLVETRAFAVMNDVVFQQDVCAAFVRVESPAAVGERVYIVNQIISQDGSLLDSERVDAPHVAQHALADVVQMIELNHVVAAGSFLITPVPAHRNGSVVEIMDVIVRDVIVPALKDDDADSRRKHPSELMQMIVADLVAQVLFKRIDPGRRLANPDSSRVEVEEFIRNDRAVLTATA